MNVANLRTERLSKLLNTIAEITEQRQQMNKINSNCRTDPSTGRVGHVSLLFVLSLLLFSVEIDDVDATDDPIPDAGELNSRT